MSTTYKLNTVRVKQAFAESIDIRYKLDDHGDMPPWLTVWGYVTLVRYDLWHETTGEDDDSVDEYYIGRSSAKPPKQRFRVDFRFPNHNADKCTIRQAYLKLSNESQICDYVSEMLKAEFEGKKIFLP